MIIKYQKKPKIMIIKYQKYAKTNTFSLSFHIVILFTQFLHIFPHFRPRHIEIRIWGWAKMGKKWGWTPPPTVCSPFSVINTKIWNFPTVKMGEAKKPLSPSRTLRTVRLLFLGPNGVLWKCNG